jgi:hypothetical protein
MDEVETSVSPFITISAHPTSAEVTAPTGVSFSVVASVTEGASLTYLWQQSTDATTWTNAGSTTSSLTIANSTGLNDVSYRVVVSATGATSVTSNVATLSVL